MRYFGVTFARFVIMAFLLTVIVIGLVIGFFSTGYIELLYIAIFCGVFDFIIIAAIHEPLVEYVKFLYKGLKTGDWD